MLCACIRPAHACTLCCTLACTPLHTRTRACTHAAAAAAAQPHTTNAPATALRLNVMQIRSKANHLGGSLDPHAAYLLARGIKTLALRVERQNSNAAALAAALQQHPQVRARLGRTGQGSLGRCLHAAAAAERSTAKCCCCCRGNTPTPCCCCCCCCGAQVARVFYPTLPDAPRAAMVSELFGGGGGMLAFEVQGGVDAAEAALKVCGATMAAATKWQAPGMRCECVAHDGITCGALWRCWCVLLDAP